MKKIITVVFGSLIIILLFSCTSIKQIGDVNLISTRNVPESNNYVLLATYAGSDKKEIRKNKGKSLEEAVDNVVSTVPGGEILKNVKVYSVSGTFISVSGDIWGIPGKTGFKGFEKGQIVLFEEYNKYLEAEIMSFVNSSVVMIKYKNDSGTERIKEVSISSIRKK